MTSLHFHSMMPLCYDIVIVKQVGFLWNRTVVVVKDKLSSTTVDFIRSERELKNCTLYGV